MGSGSTEGDSSTDVKDLGVYPPSWFDKLSGWVDRLPGPNWVKYFGFVLVLALIGGFLYWLDDPTRPIRFPAISIITFFQIAYVLSLLDFVNKRAAGSLRELRFILKVNDSQFSSLETMITTRPSRPLTITSVLIAAVFGTFGIVSTNLPLRQATGDIYTSFQEVFTKSASGYFAVTVATLLWFVNGIFIYSVIHLLRTIDTIYTQYTNINLFQQSELHAFSKVTANIAIGFVITSPLWMILDPGLISILINIAFAIMAVFIFVSPLLGVRRLLKAQKDSLIRESHEKKEILIHELFSHLEKKNFDGVKNIELALSSLREAEDEIKKISTWPWQTDTLRQVIGALLLPITIWIIQYFLNQLLSN